MIYDYIVTQRKVNMAGIFGNIAELVGNTPLMELSSVDGVQGNIYAKLEYFNPAGSIKDRAALSMIEKAEQEGKLKKGSVIIEPTSGNTGIALAAIGTVKGYRVIIVMPDSMSRERIVMMKGYGAEVVLTPGKLGMKGAIDKAEEIASVTEGAFIPSQFDNPANAEAHYKTTGPEIYKALDGKVDVLVSAVGTGGTITGTGRYLKEMIPSLYVVAVEPDSSPLLSGGSAAPHKIQGIGANFIPSILDRTIYDEVVRVKDEDAFECARMLGIKEGLSVGISSGAALKGAIDIAKRDGFKGKNIVVIFPDGGSRYLSTDLFKFVD